MNMICMIPAYSALVVMESPAFTSGGLPPRSACLTAPTSPCPMILTTERLACPNPPTCGITKDPLGMEVADCADNDFAAGIALPGFGVAGRRIRATYLGNFGAFPGAILLVSFTGARAWVSAYTALGGSNRLAPSALKVARRRTEAACFAAIPRIELRTANRAGIDYRFVSHAEYHGMRSDILQGQSEREERYCEIGARRMQQEVLNLTEAQ